SWKERPRRSTCSSSSATAARHGLQRCRLSLSSPSASATAPRRHGGIAVSIESSQCRTRFRQLARTTGAGDTYNVATWKLPEMSPWKRQALTIPPDSLLAWLTLAAWEAWMGVLVCAALGFGARLIVEAPERVVTVLDFTSCYDAPPIVQPC